MTTLFKGCFDFIFSVTVNRMDFCYKEKLWHFIIKTEFNFQTVLMFLVSTFAVARDKHNYVSFCPSSTKVCQLGNNINTAPFF